MDAIEKLRERVRECRRNEKHFDEMGSTEAGPWRKGAEEAEAELREAAINKYGSVRYLIHVPELRAK